MAPKIYLFLTPFLTFALAFIFKHSPWPIYLPIWFVHACLMVLFTYKLASPGAKSPDPQQRRLVTIGWLMILPWVLISIFAGMGPLPETLQGWIDTETEQHIRYIILIVSGVIFAGGFTLLRDALKKQGETLWSVLGFTAFSIKIVLFILNMNYLGQFMIASIRYFVTAGLAPTQRPEWYVAARSQFNGNSMVEVAITYVATAAFAASLRNAGWIKPASARGYIIFSAIGFAFCILPPSMPGPLGIGGYLASIPAFSLIVPYLMGINFLTRAGQNLRKV
jgi:hypothetical protein